MTTRPVRRLLAGAAVCGFGLLVTAPRIGAAPSAWAGSRLTTPTASSSSSFAVTAEFHHEGKVTAKTWLIAPGGLAIGCSDAGETQLNTGPPVFDSSNKTYTSSATAVTPCNGSYDLRVEGTFSPGLIPPDTYALTGNIKVLVSPSAVTGVDGTAKSDRSSVKLTWSAASDPAPDFLGYVVIREQPDGSLEEIGTVDPGTESFTDDSPPQEGSSVTYRVLARRSNGSGGEVRSTSGGKATVGLPATSTTLPDGTDGGPPTTAGGGTTGPGTGGTTGPGTGGTATTIPGIKPIVPNGTKGTTGVGTKAPNLGRSSQANFPQLADGTTDDGDYKQEINYGDKEDGLADGGSDSEDGLSSAFYEQGEGRGMAVPVATGFVLAAWAFHLRFLARAARPARVTAPRGSRYRRS